MLSVNNADPAWQAQKRSFMPDTAYGDKVERYRNWRLMRYWFRGVEQYAPWVRRIHFVTWGHLPTWLNTEHPKLHVVRHEDYLPAEMLPTFNSSLLEIYVHKIPGLAEQFVLFNDDMFLLGELKPEFFFKGGKPCDMLALQPVVANPANPGMSHVFLNNMLVLAKYFTKRQCMKAHPGNFFHVGYPPLYFCYNLLETLYPQLTGLYTVHGPSPFCKRTFEELWEKEGEYLRSLSHNRFRADSDVNQYLFREWQKLSGDFHPQNVQKSFRYFEIKEPAENEKLIHAVSEGAYRIVCVNDVGPVKHEDEVKRQLLQAFERRLPKRSEFEKE